MKFYDCSTAPSPRLVRMAIAEKGVADRIETIEVNLREGEQMGEAFRAINRFCTVPVLELDDGTRLTTTQGCWRYLEEAFPEPVLMGTTPTEKAVVADLAWRIDTDGFMAVAEALRNGSPRMTNRALPGPHDHAQIPALAERGKTRVGHFFETLETLLEGRDWLAGTRFSVADIAAFVAVEFAGWLKLSPAEGAANLQRWHRAMKERPSAAV